MKYKGIVQKRNDDNYTTIHRMWGSSFMYILDDFSLIVFSSLITFVWSNDFIPTSRANIINIITQHMRSNMGWNSPIFVSHSKLNDLRSHGKWPQECGWRTPPTILIEEISTSKHSRLSHYLTLPICFTLRAPASNVVAETFSVM